MSEKRSLAISTKVFVGNLSYRTTQDTLSAALGQAGEVRSVFIGTDRETGRSRGFAFVEFVTPEGAAEAIRKFDGQDIDGRKVRVNAAEERPSRPPSSGPPRPRPSNFAPSSGPSDWEPAPDFGDAFRRDDRGFKNNKGSRRNLRARKRSLNF